MVSLADRETDAFHCYTYICTYVCTLMDNVETSLIYMKLQDVDVESEIRQTREVEEGVWDDDNLTRDKWHAPCIFTPFFNYYCCSKNADK